MPTNATAAVNLEITDSMQTPASALRFSVQPIVKQAVARREQDHVIDVIMVMGSLTLLLRDVKHVTLTAPMGAVITVPRDVMDPVLGEDIFTTAVPGNVSSNHPLNVHHTAALVVKARGLVIAIDVILDMDFCPAQTDVVPVTQDVVMGVQITVLVNVMVLVKVDIITTHRQNSVMPMWCVRRIVLQAVHRQDQGHVTDVIRATD